MCTHLLVQRVCITVQDHNVPQLGQHLHLLLPHQNLGHQPCEAASYRRKVTLTLCISHPQGSHAFNQVLKIDQNNVHTFDANFGDPGSLPSDEDLQTAEVRPDVIIDDVCILAPPGACRGKTMERPRRGDFRRGDDDFRGHTEKPFLLFFLATTTSSFLSPSFLLSLVSGMVRSSSCPPPFLGGCGRRF